MFDTTAIQTDEESRKRVQRKSQNANGVKTIIEQQQKSNPYILVAAETTTNTS